MAAPFRGHVTSAGRPKRSYDSRADATSSLRKRGGTGEIYQCDLCRRWHVSTRRAKDILARDQD